MPLKLVRAADAQTLWDTCADRFLDEIGQHPGPYGYASHLWITHRNLRDLLFARAYARGVCGWLGLPFSFFSELPLRFEIRDRPVGLLTRRRLLSKLAGRIGRRVMKREPGRSDGVIRGHMLDSLFSELLPEGVAPDQLRAALGSLGGDEFADRRNRWVVGVYDAYQRALARRGEYDDRSIHAMIAERIDDGSLGAAIKGASALHIYGLYTPRHRERLFRALGRQAEIEVILYTIAEAEDSEFLPFASQVEEVGPADVQEPLPLVEGEPVSRAAVVASRARGVRSSQGGSEGAPTIKVQPAPDAARELDWVVRRIKRALHRGDCEPWEIAVVARSGQHDTRRAYRALRNAGVPATARIRTPMDEIAVLKALLLLFRGAAADWDYGSLRALLAHPYFDTGVDLRAIDYIATNRRVQGLAQWEEHLRKLHERVADENSRRDFRGTGVFADRVQADTRALAALRERLDPLTPARPEREWLQVTLDLLKQDFLGVRSRVCEPAAGRWDVVRLDQRGILALERLLHEWLQLEELDHSGAAEVKSAAGSADATSPPSPAAEPLDAGAWHTLLSRLLSVNELVLTTPMHKGVQVLEAHDVALTPFERLFVLHANDGEFPRAPATSTIISDQESRRLRDADLVLPDREQRLRRERALWNAVTAQRHGVSITYRTVSASGTPLLPSLMVPSHDPADELPRTRAPKVGRGVDDEPVTLAQADRYAAQKLAAAAREAAARGAELRAVHVAPAHPELLEHAVVAAVAESQRASAGGRLDPDHPALRPNPYNGELRDPVVLAKLARRFDDEYRWSASQLEAYGKCPFVFLLDRVLYIHDLEEAEEETSPLKWGGVAHAVLERFYRAVRDDLPTALTTAAAAELARACDQTFAEFEAEEEWLGTLLLWASAREQLRDALRDYLAWELPYLAEKGERPVQVELSFGVDDPATIHGDDVSGQGVRLHLRGRIDRVDESGVRQTFWDVLDYKSSAVPPAGGYLDGSTLQAALYLQVLDELGHPVRKARYRAIKKPGKPQNGAEIRVGGDKHEAALRFAFSIPARVRAGCFEPVKASASGWKPWDIGPEITRGRAQLPKGRNRFDA